MTSSRIHTPEISSGPSPQCYDVQFKLTEREKFQNDLISQRYKNWESSTSRRNGFGGDGDDSFPLQQGNAGKKQFQNMHILGRQPTSLTYDPQDYYDVREKLTEREKAQNQLLSQRYQKKGNSKSPPPRQSGYGNGNSSKWPGIMTSSQ